MDRRMRRTRNALQRALAELISEKPIAEVTVKELAERADINRSTFYLHYRSPQDVLNELEDDIVDELTGILRENNMLKSPKGIYNVLNALTVELNREPAIKNLITGTAGLELYNKVQLRLTDRLTAMFVEANPDSVLALAENAVLYSVAGMFAVYCKWLKEPAGISFDEMCGKLMSIMVYGIDGIYNSSKY